MNAKFIKNISWILFGNVLHAIFQFLLNILAARSFSENQFGLLNYGASLITFFTVISILGFDGIITKKIADDEVQAGAFLGTAIFSRLLVAITSVFIIQVLTMLLHPDEQELRKIIFWQSLAIPASCGDSIIYWFRYKSQASVVAYIRMASLGISAVIRIVAIYCFGSLELYALGCSVETLALTVILILIFLKQYGKKNRLCFNGLYLRDMLMISYPFITSGLLSTIYSQTDKIMLKSMVDNAAVAMYSVAMTITSISSIIPRALIEGFRPDVMMFKKSADHMYQKRMRQLYAIVFWMCMLFGVFVTLFAKWIIILLYGARYVPAAGVLSLVVWFTSFSYFGAINNLYFVAENKTKWVQITTAVGACCNVLFNSCLIPVWGANGAALASLITQFIANMFLPMVIPSLRSSFRMMIGGILLKNIK